MLLGLGEVAARQGHYDEARTFIEESLMIHQEYDWDELLGGDFSALAFLARSEGDYQQAVEQYKRSLPLFKDNKFDVIQALEGLAGSWAMQENTEHAVQLFGVTAAWREKMHLPLLPLDRADVERDLAILREALSEDDFNSAWHAGYVMSLEQAIDFALTVD